MTDTFAATKTICLLNENAQCNPIWMSRPDGLTLVHFLTLRQEMTGREHPPVDAAYEKCERTCLESGHGS